MDRCAKMPGLCPQQAAFELIQYVCCRQAFEKQLEPSMADKMSVED